MGNLCIKHEQDLRISFCNSLTKDLEEDATANICRALYQIIKSTVKNKINGSFDKLSYGVASSVLDKVSNFSIFWHTQDVEMVVGDPSSSFVFLDQRCQDKERDANMNKVMSNLELHTKYVLWSPIESVNNINARDTNLCEDVQEVIHEDKMIFFPTYTMGFHVASQGQCRNQGSNNENWGMT